jgi:hypothetical protein
VLWILERSKMENQKLHLSTEIRQQDLPEEFQSKFYIKRIDETDIEINLSQRNKILEALNAGQRFIQIGQYTLMLNSIKSIDPRYQPDNIPPEPYRYASHHEFDQENKVYYEVQGEEREEYVLWQKLFGSKKELTEAK